MAIDSTIFAADIPAGTYAVGDVVQLVPTDGPANVRSGRGPAKLKNVVCAQMSSNGPFWKIHVKNSDWIDDIESFAGFIQNAPAVFADDSGALQSGHDNNLTPNSGWQVWAECISGATSTGANSIYALVDIDYPEVSGVTDPKRAVGTPTTIAYDRASVPIAAVGSLVGSTWSSESVDYLKAGYKYVLDSVEMYGSQAGINGFVAFSNAAGMGGLTRIIPIAAILSGIRYGVRYSSVLQKGPMDVKLKLFGTAGTANVFMCHDYVKQKA